MNRIQTEKLLNKLKRDLRDAQEQLAEAGDNSELEREVEKLKSQLRASKSQVTKLSKERDKLKQERDDLKRGAAKAEASLEALLLDQAKAEGDESK